MRNVPVGAGRRKNKSSSGSHYRHIMVSEALRTAQVHAVNGVHNPTLRNSGTVLSFGSDSPLCESVASVLNLSEKTQNNIRNGYHRPEQRILISSGGAGDNWDDRLSGSSVTASNSSDKGGNCGPQEAITKKIINYNALQCHLGLIHGALQWLLLLFILLDFQYHFIQHHPTGVVAFQAPGMGHHVSPCNCRL